MQYWKVLLYWHEYLADKHDDLETFTKILKFLTLMSRFLVQGQVSKFYKIVKMYCVVNISSLFMGSCRQTK